MKFAIDYILHVYVIFRHPKICKLLGFKLSTPKQFYLKQKQLNLFIDAAKTKRMNK